MKRMAAQVFWTAVFWFGWTSILFAQTAIEGHWEGAILVMGTELKMMVDFKSTKESLTATIDIPQQGASGLALANVSYQDIYVHFELPAGPSVAVFHGRIIGDSITGDFQQSGVSGKFYLVRAVKEEKPVEEEPLPYKQKEVSFQNGDIKLAGTLTLPPTQGPHPAVVMITGSGPQNRDEELFGFKPFRIIADHFTRNGIAVLRYDDRGVGGSTGNTSQSTSEDFAGDVLAAVKFLQSRSDINPKQIGLCGHSEGGLVAPMVAARSKDVAFIILMSGPGVSGEKILLAQAALIAKADGATQAQLKETAQFQKQMFDAIRTGQGMDELKAGIRKKALAELANMTEEQRKAIIDREQFVNTMIEAQLKAVGTPWMKHFLDYNPALTLEKVSCPVLALFGELDLQVPAEENKLAMEKTLKKGGNKDYTFKVFPKANHLYLTAKSGSPSEYAGLKKEFVPGFLDTMADWIQKRVTVGR